MSKENFLQEVKKGYTFEGDSIDLGAAMYDRETQTGSLVKLPLSMLNRHGLIAGATGSGKTKTLQILAEQLSDKSVPVLLMDVKGDLSGIAVPSGGHLKIEERHAAIGMPFKAGSSPVEFLSLSNEPGARLRATVTEFGPVLFSKILGLNDTQSGIVALVFKYCDDKKMPLLDLKDFRKVLQFFMGEGKAEIKAEYGTMSSVSIGAIMRKMVELEQQGAEVFFGEHSFEIDDLLRIDENGKGMVSIIRLTDIQTKPKLFSSFMLQMLAEIYETLPEQGDADAPALAVFIDEAHLVFKEASDVLLDQIEATIKLIRSKGVGIFFITQNPTDIPDDVLGQLGLKIQHALRAFTARDRKAIKLAAQNYPITAHYDVAQLLTELGIGEALVTVLNEKGIPTPLVHTMLRAPQSRMDVLTEGEIKNILEKSRIIDKYNEVIDRESAYEMLNEKIEEAQEEENQARLKREQEKAKKTMTRRRRPEKSMLEKVMTSKTTQQIGRTMAQELTRGLLGVLGIKSTSRRRRKSSWF